MNHQAHTTAGAHSTASAVSEKSSHRPRRSPCTRLAGLTAATLLLTLSTRAQPTPQPEKTAADSPVDEKTVELSPFTVNAAGDEGYRSRNAVSATRLNKPLTQTPMPIEVVTREFMEDVGATNLREALKYSAGVVTRSQNDAYSASANGANNTLSTSLGGGTSSLNAQNPQGVTANFGGATYKIRGFVTPTTLRDGFIKRTQTDAIAVDRVEVVRGPSALLYGTGSFGGIVNDIPKRPLNVSRQYFELGVGDRGYLRGAFDSTGPLIDKKLAYRIMGAVQDVDLDHTGVGEATTRFIEPVFSYRPFENTRILADIEIMNYKETGNGFQLVHQIFTPNASDVPAAFPLDGTFLTTDSNGRPMRAASTLDPRDAKLSGPDTFAETKNYNVHVDLEQKLTDNIFLKGGINFYSANNALQQVGAQLQVQTPGLSNRVNVRPSDWTTFGSLSEQITERWRSPILARNGFIYTERALLAYAWQQNRIEDESVQSRVELNGTWAFLRGTHSVLLGRTDTKREVRNRIWQQRDFNYRSPSDFTPMRFGEPHKNAARTPQTPLLKQPGSETYDWEQGSYAVLNSSFFEDRINLIAGLRHDRADSRTLNLTGGDLVNSISDRSAYAKEAPSKNSKQLGLSVKVVKGLHVFTSYSEGLIPNYGVTNGNNQPFSPTTAKSKEVGIKFDLLESKLSGTVSAFQINRKNAPRLIWWAPQEKLPGQVGAYDPTKPTVMLGYLPGAFVATANPTTLAAVLADTFTVNGASRTGASLLASEGGYYVKLPTLAGSTNYDPSSPGYQLMQSFFDWMRATREINDIGWVFNTSGQDGVKLVNAPGMYSGGTYIPIEDQSKGVDAQIVFTPTRNLEMVLTYAYIVREQTVGYNYVDTPYYNPFSMWYFPELFWGTMDFRRVEDAYADPRRPSTFKSIPSLVGEGRGLDDQPKHSGAVWTKYTFDGGALDRFNVALGYSYSSSQEYYSGYAPDGNAILFKNGATASDVVSLRTKASHNFDLQLGYSKKLAGRYEWTIRLNVFNLLNDEDLYGNLWAPGRSFKITNSIAF
jgi:iron complex outermembrane recepter protein